MLECTPSSEGNPSRMSSVEFFIEQDVAVNTLSFSGNIKSSWETGHHAPGAKEKPKHEGIHFLKLVIGQRHAAN